MAKRTLEKNGNSISIGEREVVISVRQIFLFEGTLKPYKTNFSFDFELDGTKSGFFNPWRIEVKDYDHSVCAILSCSDISCIIDSADQLREMITNSYRKKEAKYGNPPYFKYENGSWSKSDDLSKDFDENVGLEPS